MGNSLCDLCGRMCSDKAALNIHIIRQHDPNQPVKCPNCSCRFQSKNLLSKHLKFECIEKTLPKPTPPKSLMIQKRFVEQRGFSVKCDIAIEFHTNYCIFHNWYWHQNLLFVVSYFHFSFCCFCCFCCSENSTLIPQL